MPKLSLESRPRNPTKLAQLLPGFVILRYPQAGQGNGNKAEIFLQNGHTQEIKGHTGRRKVISEVTKKAEELGIKVVALGITGANGQTPKLIKKAWKRDIVPIELEESTDDPIQLLATIANGFDEVNSARVRYGPSNEVIPSTTLVTIEDYRKDDPEFMLMAETLAEEFQGQKMVFFNPTPRGGGVALMRNSLTRMAMLLKKSGKNVDIHWHLLDTNDSIVNVTKGKFHNVLQAVAEQGVELTEADKAEYLAWSAENAKKLEPAYRDAKIVVIDDPQAVGLIPHIKRCNPKIKIIYRSHIQIEGELADKEGTPQNKTWQFLWETGIKDADMFIAHPLRKFVPRNVPREKVFFMGATTDALDGLNKKLSKKLMKYYYNEINNWLEQQGQTPLDLNRPYATQIARFDPSKGIPEAIHSFAIVHDRMIKEGQVAPQFVIGGHGARDDNDRVRIYEQAWDIIHNKYPHLANDIKLVFVPDIDQPLNALVQGAKFVTQLSYKEGYEIKVSEAQRKGKTVIASKEGGIPLQLEDGRGSFLVDPMNHAIIADHMYNLFTNKKFRKMHSKLAIANANSKRENFAPANLAKWIALGIKVLREDKITDGYETSVTDVAKTEHLTLMKRKGSEAGNRRRNRNAA